MGRLLILVGLLLGLAWFLWWFKRTPPAQVARTLRKAALWIVVGGLILAAATGRLNPVFAAIGALIPIAFRLLNLVQLLPALQRVLRSLGVGGGVLGGGSAGASGGTGSGQSAIRTRYLAMTLDHATGVMDGEILEGPYSGQRLSDLGLHQLLRMLELYRDSDAQSAAVLEAYLDREHPDWRDQEPPPGRAGAGGGGAPMTEHEALAILGLEPGADRDAIRDAHRRLMQKLHPDRGGSDYLAAKINEAKRFLLGD